jgi:hypothetical protein
MMSKKKNKSAPTENPFSFHIEPRIVGGAKKKEKKKDKDSLLIEGVLVGRRGSTGELKNFGGFSSELDADQVISFFGEEKIVDGSVKFYDAEKHIKIYDKGLRLAVGLGAMADPWAALLSAASRSGTDHCKPNFSAWGVSETSELRWIKKLKEAGVIADHPEGAGRFWVNLGMFSGCDRAKKLRARAVDEADLAIDMARARSLTEFKLDSAEVDSYLDAANRESIEVAMDV